ncbi:hypothetical protein [Haloglycomyces albus]|uniref:hypothetical protein n=1 Tax=Haloglycomyces albus TaxID=526067 RepID=UPI0004AF8BFC|nr:hypothetical protein [Haloglycomyces albus]
MRTKSLQRLTTLPLHFALTAFGKTATTPGIDVLGIAHHQNRDGNSTSSPQIHY